MTLLSLLLSSILMRHLLWERCTAMPRGVLSLRSQSILEVPWWSHPKRRSAVDVQTWARDSFNEDIVVFIAHITYNLTHLFPLLALFSHHSLNTLSPRFQSAHPSCYDHFVLETDTKFFRDGSILLIYLFFSRAKHEEESEMRQIFSKKS